MINITYIYYLHKGDNIPCYIGKTVNYINREKFHRVKRGREYKLEILDEVNSDEWKFWEEWYINLFKNWGFELENKSSKGRGCGIRPCTWGNKISDKLKGKVPNWSKEEIGLRKTRLKGKQFALGYKYSIQQKNNCVEGKRNYYFQYDLKGNYLKEWYATKLEIAKFYEKDSSCLTHHLHGRQKSAFGFVWKVKSGEDK